MKTGFAGTGYIHKTHAQTAQTLALDLVAVENHRPESLAEFGKCFGSVFSTRLLLLNEEEQRVEVIESGFPPQESHQPQSLYDEQLNYFIQCIERNRTPVPGGLEGWINRKVVDAAYESSQTGKVVEVK